MDYGAFLVAVAVIAFALYRASKKNTLPATLPATSDDWFVVFHENYIADKKKQVLGLSFYPIIGFDRGDDETIPITSRPKFTKQHASSVVPEKGTKVGDPASRTYGVWVRNGAMFRSFGHPFSMWEVEGSTGFSDFSDHIETYLIRGFVLSFETSTPLFYQGQINNAIERFKRCWETEFNRED